MQSTSATIEIKGMAPLLQVFDMPASIAFYRDTLGFPIDPDGYYLVFQWPVNNT